MSLSHLLKSLSVIFLLTFYSSGFALSSDADLPYHFKSDSIVYNRKQRTTTYIGHVYVTQGTTRISGNKLVVQYGGNGQVKRMVDTGNLAHYSTVPDHQPRLYAQAKKIIFNPVTKIVLLGHQGKVTQEKNVFTGPHIWYDIAAGVVQTTPKKNQETVIVIQPQDK